MFDVLASTHALSASVLSTKTVSRPVSAAASASASVAKDDTEDAGIVGPDSHVCRDHAIFSYAAKSQQSAVLAALTAPSTTTPDVGAFRSECPCCFEDDIDDVHNVQGILSYCRCKENDHDDHHTGAIIKAEMVSTPLGEDVSHWRIPGEDDLGQAARQALYELGLSDDDEGEGFLEKGAFATQKSGPATPGLPSKLAEQQEPVPNLEWDWEIDALDRQREAKHDSAFATAHASTGMVGRGGSAIGGEDTDAPPLIEVDRRVMRDVVREKMGADVARIRFISSGTFHKAYLITLSSRPLSFASSVALDDNSLHPTLVLRVARRFLPRLKTESEVATLAYLRQHTSVPVPEVFHYDSNPYNRLGGEYILMSKASGIPLSKVYHSLPHAELIKLLDNLARIVIPLFGHRFPQIGSLYLGESADASVNVDGQQLLGQEQGGKKEENAAKEEGSVKTPIPLVDLLGSAIPTPKASSASRMNTNSTLANHLLRTLQPLAPPPPITTTVNGVSSNPSVVLSVPVRSAAAPLGAGLDARLQTSHASTSTAISQTSEVSQRQKFHVGPIVSWPFFGSARASLSHTSKPPEIDRGPWPSEHAYCGACADREVRGVERENEGRAKPHRLRMDPDEVVVRVKAVTKGKGDNGRRNNTNLRKGNASNARKSTVVAPTVAPRKAGGGGTGWGWGYVPGARDRGTPDGDGAQSPVSTPAPLQHAASTSSINKSHSSGSSSSSASDSELDDEEDELSTASSPSLASDEDVLYRDYRCFQRSTFLVAELQRRRAQVVGEMGRWQACMREMRKVLDEVLRGVGCGDSICGGESFGLDCHDLSLENVFVDENDPSKITCIIDWESTTTRPLWACAHLPSFLLTSPFASKLFRRAVSTLACAPSSTSTGGAQEDDEKARIAKVAAQWLLIERVGAPLRYAHKAAEWDGWEEGLVGSILGELDEDDLNEDQQQGVLVGGLSGGLLKIMDDSSLQRRASISADAGMAKPGWEEPLVAQMKRMCMTLAFASGQHQNSHTVGGGRKRHFPHNALTLPFPLSVLTGAAAVPGPAVRTSSSSRARHHHPLDLSNAQTSTSSAELTPGVGPVKDPLRSLHPLGNASHSSSTTAVSSKLKLGQSRSLLAGAGLGASAGAPSVGGRRHASHGMEDVMAGAEREREKMLDMNGDVCGGRGGELGRRLEAWLVEGEGDAMEGGDEDTGSGMADGLGSNAKFAGVVGSP